jgi:hypothetical protein
VLVFMNKDLAAPQKPLEPLILLNLDLPDGRSFEKLVTFPAESWSAATDHADVRIAGNGLRPAQPVAVRFDPLSPRWGRPRER